MTASFWTGGPQAHDVGVKKQHKQKLQQLQSKLSDCSDTERSRIEQQIQAAKENLQAELKSTKWKLF